ncbi:MAG: peptidoglycan editing factor PgeF [Rhodospirillales bacterium]|nr:peptidoglycan editing factor PgeF [Rhodospirillales bacterium]
MITSEIVTAHPRIAHGFFTREGGVSEGIYASLNCGLGSNDDPARVRVNRARAMDALGVAPESLTTAYQVHSASVGTVDASWRMDDRLKLDGLVTRTPGVTLGILTADCAPVLFAEPQAGVVGAAHAGWRGALDGIVDATVAAMVALGAERKRIVAAVGPCIRQESYEVGADFRTTFVAADPDNGALFAASDRGYHFRFDLPGYVARRLSALDLAAVDDLHCDTSADADRFFSYRRTTLNGGGDYGRQLSAIAVLA